MGLAREKTRRQNARPSDRNLDLCRKSDRAVRFSLLSILWLRSGILWRVRVPSWLQPPRASLRVFRRSVLRSFLLFLHSTDDYSPVPNRHLFKRTRDVVPVPGAAVPLTKILVA